MVAVYGSSQTGRFTVGDRDAGRSIGTVTGIRYSESWRNVHLGVHAGDYAHQSTTGPELAAGEKVIVREVLK